MTPMAGARDAAERGRVDHRGSPFTQIASEKVTSVSKVTEPTAMRTLRAADLLASLFFCVFVFMLALKGQS
jgi:hypothetical protein